MTWVIVNKKEVEAMFEERRREDRRRVDADIAACNARHDEHDKHREASEKTMISFNNTITELTKTLNTTNDTLTKYLPNFVDAEEKRAAKHQLKEGALLVSAVLGAVIAIGTVLLFVSAYFNGYFVK